MSSSSDDDSDPEDETDKFAAPSVRVDSSIPDLSKSSVVSTSPANFSSKFGVGGATLHESPRYRDWYIVTLNTLRDRIHATYSTISLFKDKKVKNIA